MITAICIFLVIAFLFFLSFSSGIDDTTKEIIITQSNNSRMEAFFKENPLDSLVCPYCDHKEYSSKEKLWEDHIKYDDRGRGWKNYSVYGDALDEIKTHIKYCDKNPEVIKENEYFQNTNYYNTSSSFLEQGYYDIKNVKNGNLYLIKHVPVSEYNRFVAHKDDSKLVGFLPNDFCDLENEEKTFRKYEESFDKSEIFVYKIDTITKVEKYGDDKTRIWFSDIDSIVIKGNQETVYNSIFGINGEK